VGKPKKIRSEGGEKELSRYLGNKELRFKKGQIGYFFRFEKGERK